jgi:hypothetical protein
VLFTAGMACVTIAACAWLMDVPRTRALLPRFITYGLNPFVAFVGSGMLARVLRSDPPVPGRRVSSTAIYRRPSTRGTPRTHPWPTRLPSWRTVVWDLQVLDDAV